MSAAVHIWTLAGSTSLRRSPMSDAERERDVRGALEAGNVPDAVALALEAYGAEVFGFLVASVDDRVVARDIYAALHDRLGRTLGGFTWHTSLRTWIYALALRELAPERLQRRGGVQGDPTEISLPDPTTASAARPDLPSSTTVTVEELRASLSPMDRGLLVLSVDRRLSSLELASALAEEGASADAIARVCRDLDARIVEVCVMLAEAAIVNRLLPPR